MKTRLVITETAMQSTRSNNGEVAALQVEMENANEKLDELKGDIKEIKDIVGGLGDKFVTRAEFDRELSLLRSNRYLTVGLSTISSGALTFLVTYFLMSANKG